MKFLIHSNLLILLLSCQSILVFSQQHQDTLTYSIGAFQTISQEDYAPHYLTANRFGIFDLQDGQATLLRANAFSKHHLFEKGSLFLGADAFLKASYQAPTISSAFLQQAYAAFQYSFLKLTVGKIERTVGTHEVELSSGSLAISRNAPPMPQILLEVPEYTNVPFTKGFVQFKGTFAHSWFNDERFIDNSLLHEKSLYVRFGGKHKFKFHTGIVHFVVWGGEHPTEGKIPSTFRDYIRVITAQSAENVPDDLTNISGESLNALGDNLGIYDFGASLSLKNLDLEAYYQMPYEDWSGLRPWKNKDGLLGVVIKNKTNFPYISKINYEYINTLHQSGPGLTDEGPNDYDNFGYSYGGRDNYYNNYLYKTGWTYRNHIMGTPLFFTEERAQTYMPGFRDPDKSKFNFNIVNNRIVAHHVGVKGRVIPHLEYKLLVTTTLNYGTWGGINGGIQQWGSMTNPDLEYEFAPPLRQNYILLETIFNVNNNVDAYLTGSLDTGELSDNIAILIGLRWSGGKLIEN